MKIFYRLPSAVLVAGYLLVKLAEFVLYPLKDIPEPDFNNKYDSTML